MKFLMCEPGEAYFGVDDLKVHNIKERSNKELAISQHRVLSSLIRSLGHDVIMVEELEGHPNSVFVKDPVYCTPYGYIKLRMGLESRRGEEEWLSKALDSFGIKCLGELKAPATGEGGDIVITERLAFIGLSSRTNLEGVQKISEILSNFGYESRMIKVPSPYLHLGGAMTYVGENKIICVETLEGNFDGVQVLKVPAGDFISGNVIFLPPDNVIAEESNVETIKLLRTVGFNVYGVNLSEFVKGTGGPTCLIQPI
ncbi:MAG: dimethylarginine dimethylaminohydrolase family protein [Athalassotoga sp.]|uniref:dimethylarginine dimethylaminohydrolase family protein n=1 Tax=Athalassotoga sp. TaxID=2022597 RepID=UPI00175D9727|nr:amidinotransferase [Mesoaciditoga lauensis]